MRQLHNRIGNGYGSAQFWELNKQEVNIKRPAIQRVSEFNHGTSSILPNETIIRLDEYDHPPREGR